MGAVKNPWVDRFKAFDTLEKIRARVNCRPSPLVGLERELPGVAEVFVEKALESIYFASVQELQILKYLLERASAHCRVTYPGVREYIERLYAGRDLHEHTFQKPTCLLGPAGVGKSQLMKAFGRLMPNNEVIDVDKNHANMPLHGSWLVTANSSQSVIRTLRPHIGEAMRGVVRASVAECLQTSSDVAFRNGVSYLVIDETQFVVGSDATVTITKMLMNVAELGIPVLFVANYSLWRALERRHEQIKQRLLTNPQLLLPEAPGSVDWQGYLRECALVLGDSIVVDVLIDGDMVYDMTAGLKRFVVLLLKSAYRIAWEEGQHVVTLRHVEQAYGSRAYAVARRQVNVMVDLFSDARTAAAYSCPIEMPLDQVAAMQQYRAQRSQKAIAEATRVSAMTVAERREEKDCTSPNLEKIIVEKRPKRPKRTVEELVVNGIQAQEAGGIYARNKRRF